MMKLIRPIGLVAFFVIILALYFSVDSVLKKTIEAGAEAAFDAKASIADVTLDFSESRLSISNMKVGDKDAPMMNLFEFDQAVMDLDVLKAFLGHVIVDELSVTGLRLATARSSSALLSKPSKIELQMGEDKNDASEENIALEAIDKALPTADQILARESLLTDQYYNQVKETLDQASVQWQNIEGKLPSDEQLENYEQEIKQLTKAKIKSIADFEAKQKELKRLKKAMKQDKAVLQQAQKFIKQNSDVIGPDLKQLKNAPKQDLENIKRKYSLNDSGVLNVSGLLFGSSIQNVSTEGLRWYKKIKPLLAESEEDEEPVKRQMGQVIHFSNKRLPDFWIKKAQMTAELDAGTFGIEVSNLTGQQKLTGQPISISAKSEVLNNIEVAQFDLLLDYRDESHERLAASITNYQLSDLTLSQDKNLQLSLAKARSDITAVVERKQSGTVTDINMRFQQAEFSGTAKDEISLELIAALSSIEAFFIRATAENAESDYNIESDLDKKLKKAVQGRFKEKQAELEAQLKGQLNDKLNGYMAGLNVDGLGFDVGVDGQLQKIDHLLDEQLDSYQDQQEDKAKEKLKNKLKKLF